MAKHEITTRPVLPDVTLVAVTSVAFRATLDAIEVSMRRVDFGTALLLSDKPLEQDALGVTWRPIRPLRSRADYSRFMLHELADHVSTAHALCIQWDGYVLNGPAWDAEFLDYDYVGAVWPQFSDGHRVGNGGFSLRSKRLLEACRDLSFDGSQPEDVLIGRVWRTRLEKQGLRFAPEHVARRFSYERTPPSGREFGFHGAFNLVRHRSPDEAVRIFAELEPELLTTGETRALLRWAIINGRGRLGLVLMRRLANRWRNNS
jgi:hypothetical protein